jgi:hypothetical protein
MRRASIIVVALGTLGALAAMTGCGADHVDPALEDAAAGLPPVGAPGTYAVTTSIEVTAAAVLPEPVSGYLEILRRLRDDPGGTFFELLDAAGVPLVAELRAALPDRVERELTGWINAAIPAELRAEIDALLAVADTALTRFELLSELDLPHPDAAGRARATHRLTAVRFGVAGDPVVIPIPESPGLPLVTESAVDATIAGARLALGDHAFGLRHGELVYALLEATAHARFGVGLREALGELVSCPAVAAEVAARCVVGICVGHQAELEALCERGLDEVIEELFERLVELRFDALRLASGEAGIGVAGLEAGVWRASLDAGMGPRVVPATFTAARR